MMRAYTGGAVGIVELPHLTDAIRVLDVMLKTAGVSLVTWEKRLGGRLVTIIVTGEVAAAQEAVSAAKNSGVGKIVASVVIPNPHSETVRMINKSAAKFMKDAEKPAEDTEEPVKTAAKSGKNVKKSVKSVEEQTNIPIGGNEDGITGIGHD